MKNFIKRIIPLNSVIRILIISDFFLLFGWGLISPILAIFITQQIRGGDVGVAGMAIGIYWLTKSFLQIPIGKYLDRNHGEKDDFYFLVAGTFLASLVPIGYIFANQVWHLYSLQIFQAFAMSLTIPSWGGIFIRHIDKGKEAFSYGVESTSISIGAGIAGIAGGTAAKIFGFTPLFIGVSALNIAAAFLLLMISKDLFLKIPKKEKSYLISKGEL